MAWFSRAIPDSQPETRATYSSPELDSTASEAAPASAHASELPEASHSHTSNHSGPSPRSSPTPKRKPGRPPLTDEQRAQRQSALPSNTSIKRGPGRPPRAANQTMTTAVSTNVPPEPPRKRGRPPKSAVSEEPPNKKARPSDAVNDPPLRRGRSSMAVFEPPRKRGRPQKETVAAEPVKAAPVTGRGRGRPRLLDRGQNNSVSANSLTPQPAKNRGRPPKVKRRGRPRLSDEAREAREAAKQLTETPAKRGRGRPRKSEILTPDTETETFEISMIKGHYVLESDEVSPQFSEHNASMQLTLEEDKDHPGSFNGSFSLGDVEGVMHLAPTEESLDQIWDLNKEIEKKKDNVEGLVAPAIPRSSRKRETDRSAKLERWLEEASDSKVRLLMKWSGIQPTDDDAIACSADGSDGFIDFGGNGTTLECFAQVLSSHFMDTGLHFTGRKISDDH